MTCAAFPNRTVYTGVIQEQDVLRQSLHELLIDPLLASAMPSQVRQIHLQHAKLGKDIPYKQASCLIPDAPGFTESSTAPEAHLLYSGVLLSACCVVLISRQGLSSVACLVYI